MELVEKTDISKISVSDLSAKAVVNRSTFYLHYRDVSAVADDLDKEIAETICGCIDNFTISDIYGSTLTLFRKLTSKLDENPQIKQYIFFSTNSDNVISRLKQIFVDKTMQSILNKFPSLRQKDIIYPLTYAASGIVDSYTKWIRLGGIEIDCLIDTVSAITKHIIEEVTKV